jgi:hypothetical protein
MPRLFMCIDNAGYPSSLEVRRLGIYVSDPTAEAQGLLRVRQESGRTYVYPRDLFAPYISRE